MSCHHHEGSAEADKIFIMLWNGNLYSVTGKMLSHEAVTKEALDLKLTVDIKTLATSGPTALYYVPPRIYVSVLWYYCTFLSRSNDKYGIIFFRENRIHSDVFSIFIIKDKPLISFFSHQRIFIFLVEWQSILFCEGFTSCGSICRVSPAPLSSTPPPSVL